MKTLRVSCAGSSTQHGQSKIPGIWPTGTIPVPVV